MKNLLLIALILLSSIYSNAQNATIEINIDSPTSATKKLTSGGQTKSSINDLDFSDGNGKLIITNKTKDDVTVEFIDFDAKPVFKIPSSSIDKKSNDGDGDKVTSFSISPVGLLTPTVPNGSIGKELGFIVNTKSKKGVESLAAIKISGAARDSNPPLVIESNTAQHLNLFVEKEISRNGYTYVGGQNNLIIDENGIIHIYLDENGYPIFTYFPVSAKENYDKFQIHILSTSSNSFIISSTGEFSPIEISDEVETKVAVTQSDGGEEKIIEFKSPIFGPYSKVFPFTIYKKGSDGSTKLILDKSIKLLKANRVSLNTGVVSTWLRSPENIAVFVKPNGDSTLVADDPSVRGYLTLMLTFHFIPRNLNIQTRNIAERFGISVGTNLSSNAFDNFFLGLNTEITNGLFFNVGGHFGRVNHVVNYRDSFKYGEQKFTGTLLTKRKWDANWYVGINVDAALFVKVFKNILSPTSNGTN